MITGQFLKRSYAVVRQLDVVCLSLYFGDPRSTSCFFSRLLFPLKRHVSGNANKPDAEQRQTSEGVPVDRDPPPDEATANVCSY
jgi:hypothetical protein